MTDTHADIKDILERATKRDWFYDGEDMDSEAAASWGGNGYEIFNRDKDGDVDEPVGSVLTEEDAQLICAAVNSFETNRALIAELVEFVKNYSKGEKTMAQCDADAREILAKTEGL